MENGTSETQATHEVLAPSAPLMHWGCKLPVRLVDALKTYSQRSGIPQTTIVKRVLAAHLRDVGAL